MMNDGTVDLRIGGDTLTLHPDRAVLWRERRTLVVADTHFGKSELFRRHGLAVPWGSDELDRQRLRRLIEVTEATRLVVLGDFLHAPLDPTSADARELEAWCVRLVEIDIYVIAGNHDRRASRGWPSAVKWQNDALQEGPFCFTHDAGAAASTGAAASYFTLSGHIHPVARVGGPRRGGLRVPVFWQSDSGLVLPSFGSFTGGFAVAPATGDRLFAAAGERVVPFGTLGK